MFPTRTPPELVFGNLLSVFLRRFMIVCSHSFKLPWFPLRRRGKCPLEPLNCIKPLWGSYSPTVLPPMTQPTDSEACYVSSLFYETVALAHILYRSFGPVHCYSHISRLGADKKAQLPQSLQALRNMNKLNLDNKGPTLTAVTIAFLSFAVITYGVRVYVRCRLVRSFGIDDFILSGAAVRKAASRTFNFGSNDRTTDFLCHLLCLCDRRSTFWHRKTRMGSYPHFERRLWRAGG